MQDRLARCTNRDYCTLGDRGAVLRVAAGDRFFCPECAHKLTEAPDRRARQLLPWQVPSGYLGCCRNRDACSTARQGQVLRVAAGAPFTCPECAHALVPAADRRVVSVSWRGQAAAAGVVAACIAVVLISPHYQATRSPVAPGFAVMQADDTSWYDSQKAELAASVLGLLPSWDGALRPRPHRMHGPQEEIRTADALVSLHDGIPPLPGMPWHERRRGASSTMPWRQALIMAALMTPGDPPAPAPPTMPAPAPDVTPPLATPAPADHDAHGGAGGQSSSAISPGADAQSFAGLSPTTLFPQSGIARLGPRLDQPGPTADMVVVPDEAGATHTTVPPHDRALPALPRMEPSILLKATTLATPIETRLIVLTAPGKETVQAPTIVADAAARTAQSARRTNGPAVMTTLSKARVALPTAPNARVAILLNPSPLVSAAPPPAPSPAVGPVAPRQPADTHPVLTAVLKKWFARGGPAGPGASTGAAPREAAVPQPTPANSPAPDRWRVALRAAPFSKGQEASLGDVAVLQPLAPRTVTADPPTPEEAAAEAAAPHKRVIVLPAAAKFTFGYGALKDVQLPTAEMRSIFLPARPSTAKPKPGSLTVSCDIETTGVPTDCRVLNAQNAAMVTNALLGWLGSGLVHYPPKMESGEAVRARRTITVDFPAESAR